MKKSDVFWQTYLKLEKELLEISKYVYITDEKIVNHVSQTCTTQLETFSPHIADLIIRTCIEIEAISKELYFDFGGQKPRGSSDLFFDEDCLKLIDIKCKTHKKIVVISCLFFNITKDENKVFKPLKEAHKRKGTDWEKAYQALKHDRYSSLCYGTIKNLLHAMGALYLLNIYYRNIKLNFKYLETSNLDYSFGSSIFSIKKPSEKYVIDVINGKEFNIELLVADDSPFVLKYTNQNYKIVVEDNKNCNQKLQEFISQQPELNDPVFLAIANNGIKNANSKPNERFSVTQELCKYRLNNKIPNTLPFEERKKLFIDSQEWNKVIRKRKDHLLENQLTEKNIQSEIDNAGILAGFEIEEYFCAAKLNKAINEGYCELVLDKGEVKYN